MTIPTKIAIAASALCVAALGGGVALWALGGGAPDGAASVARADSSAQVVEQGGVASASPQPADPAVPAATPLATIARPGQPPLEVYGPCFDDTRGDDVLSSDEPKAQTDCFVLRNGGRDLLNMAGRASPVYVRIVGQERSTQTVLLGEADSVLEVDGTFDMRIAGPKNRDNVLLLPDLTRININFVQEDMDVVVRTVNGPIRLVGQAEDDGQTGVIARIVLAGGEVVERSQIRVQAVFEQGTPGDDYITDTDEDDSIYPKGGNDTIALNGGKNRVLYESGDKVISSDGGVASFNSIDFALKREDVTIMPSENGRDVIVETPNGRLTFLLQMFHPLDDPRLPVHELRFQGSRLDAAGIRFAAEQFQDSKSSVVQEDRARLRD